MGTELNELLERYRRGPELIAAVTTGAAGAELDFVPEPGRWSVRQIVAHLADSEIVSAERLRRVIAEENPLLPAFDQDAWARTLGYERRRIADSLELFRRLRAENYRLLTGLPEEVFERSGTHSERGRITLRELVASAIEHVEGHARQIQSLRAAWKERRQQS
ncbi:MAG: DinB family protein [Bryobacterales bacterium]|nr:DinB family protein [Bryobacterales bacterium]